MAKQKLTELYTPYPEATGRLTERKPAVIRVRRISEWGGRAHYYMDGLRWPVPAWMRHLDGRTWRGVLLALAVLAALGYGLVRLVLRGAK